MQNYPESCEIYNRLVYYRNLVPRTQSEFLPWRDLLLDQVDEVHHEEINDIYSNYDAQNIGDQIITQIDYLLATYYPNGACQIISNTMDGYSGRYINYNSNSIHEFIHIVIK